MAEKKHEDGKIPKIKLDNKNTKSIPTIDTKEMSESRNRIKR